MLRQLIASAFLAASLLSVAPANAEYYVGKDGRTKYTIVRDSKQQPIMTIVKRPGRPAVVAPIKQKGSEKVTDPAPKKMITDKDKMGKRGGKRHPAPAPKPGKFVPQPNREPSGTLGAGSR